ncbi:MAG: amino acid permease, partial [Orrella sp.]
VQPAAAFVGRDAALTAILQQATGSKMSSILLALGAGVSIFSVTLVSLFGQARIYFAMARDGILPAALKRVDPHTFCPRRGTLLSAAVVSPLAGFLPSHVLWGLVSMGTLAVFLAVAVSLILLRQQQAKQGQQSRGCRVPGYPITPLLSVTACLYLISNLNATVYGFFAAWVALALLFYFIYARHGAAAQRQRLSQGKIAT